MQTLPLQETRVWPERLSACMVIICSQTQKHYSYNSRWSDMMADEITSVVAKCRSAGHFIGVIIIINCMLGS